MTDKHVDELLADLDRALAVEPSPSVAAAVRTRIAETPARGWFGRHGLHVAAAAAVVMVVASYLAWSSSAQLPKPAQIILTGPVETPAVTASVPPAVIVPPALTTAIPGVGRTRSSRMTSVRTAAAVEREPEVLVSPSQRLGLEQLAAALRDGRISADAIPADGPIVLPDPIVITTVVIEPFKVDVVPGRAGGQGIR